MWTIIITLVIGLLIILFARKFQNNESLSTSASEDASFIDNVLYTFEIVSESSYQTNLKTIVENTAPASKLIEVAARVLSEPSNPSDRHALRVEVQGLTVGYLNSQDGKQLAGHNIDKKVSAAITTRKQTNPDQVNYTVKLALKQLDDLR